MKRLLVYLFIVFGLGLVVGVNANSNEVGVDIPYLGGSDIELSYKNKIFFEEKIRLNYNKSCKHLYLKENGILKNKRAYQKECKWSQSGLAFKISTRLGLGNERVFTGYFSSLEESKIIKNWSYNYKIKNGKFSYPNTLSSGRIRGVIKFNPDEIAKLSTNDENKNSENVNNIKLEEEKKKIAEEKRKIEEEKRKIAEAKKKQEEEEKKRKEANAKLYVIGSGTGFFVSSEGHAVSNDHVVGICRKVATKIDGKKIHFNILKTDKVNDIGLIKGDYKSSSFLSIKSDGAEFGEDIVAFGYPLTGILSSSVKLTRGIVSSLSGLNNNYSEIQIDAAIQPGNSGGPVLNMEGQVVGVASSGLNKLAMIEETAYIPENVNFAVAAPTLLNFLKANGVTTKNEVLKINNTNELAKVGRPATIQLFCLNTKAKHEELKKKKKHSDVLLEKVIELN